MVRADIGPGLLIFGSSLLILQKEHRRREEIVGWCEDLSHDKDVGLERRSLKGHRRSLLKQQRVAVWKREFVPFMWNQSRCHSESDSYLHIREAFPNTWSFNKLESWDLMSFHTWEYSSIYLFLHSTSIYGRITMCQVQGGSNEQSGEWSNEQYG